MMAMMMMIVEDMRISAMLVEESHPAESSHFLLPVCRRHHDSGLGKSSLTRLEGLVERADSNMRWAVDMVVVGQVER